MPPAAAGTSVPILTFPAERLAGLNRRSRAAVFRSGGSAAGLGQSRKSPNEIPLCPPSPISTVISRSPNAYNDTLEKNERPSVAH